MKLNYGSKEDSIEYKERIHAEKYSHLMKMRIVIVYGNSIVYLLPCGN